MMSATPPAKLTKAKLPERKLSATALRRLARAHTPEAVQALVEVATKGTSEASRISAAIALLERGYGKSGAGLALEGRIRPPVLYHWIELIDGTAENPNASHQASHDKTSHDQD